MNRLDSKSSPTLWKEYSSGVALVIDRFTCDGPFSKDVPRIKKERSSKRQRSKGALVPSPPSLMSLFHVLPIIEEEDSSSRWKSLPILASSDQLDKMTETGEKDFTRRQTQVTTPESRGEGPMMNSPLSSERKRSRPTLPRRQKSVECLDIGMD